MDAGLPQPEGTLAPPCTRRHSDGTGVSTAAAGARAGRAHQVTDDPGVRGTRQNPRRHRRLGDRGAHGSLPVVLVARAWPPCLTGASAQTWMLAASRLSQGPSRLSHGLPATSRTGSDSARQPRRLRVDVSQISTSNRNAIQVRPPVSSPCHTVQVEGHGRRRAATGSTHGSGASSDLGTRGARLRRAAPSLPYYS